MNDLNDDSLLNQARQWQRVKTLLAQALEVDAAQRPAFLAAACADDAALQAEVQGLLDGMHAAADDALEQPGAALLLEALEERTAGQRVGQRLGPYRIVSLIARGGMGEVYRAERADGQYEQQVAVKLMRDGLQFDPAGQAAARFKAERQILASLDHPNLAKVLDGGITDDGLPYFVMEFVAGDPIDIYCDRLQLPVDARLRLFRTVCQVAHYAHQKGVVHRDLKTANILVTHDGTVKLVDFGIAKRLTEDAPAPTATAFRAMTLAYSSPEQIVGGTVTPASDIYSLGVVLYRLLTGTSPYPGAVTASDYELARIICDTEPLPPSRAAAHGGLPQTGGRHRLGADLDAMVMMALRKDPGKRYGSAEQFADDVFRHLEHLPVLARRGAWGYRASQFVLRHRGVVAAVLVANLALAAGLALAAYEAYEAQQQRARAERHFQSVRKLANVFMFDVHDAIRVLPGSTAARKLLVQNALTYLQELSAEKQEDQALQLEVAKGFRRIGDIQGRPNVSNLGDPQGASTSYEKARDLLAPLATPTRGSGTDRVAQQEYVIVHQRLGALFDALGQFKKGDEVLRQGTAVAIELAAADPSHQARQLILASMYAQHGDLRLHTGDVGGYMTLSDAAARQLEALRERAPEDVDIALNLAAVYQSRGEHFMEDDTTQDAARTALEAFRKTVAVVEPLFTTRGNNTSLARQVAVGHQLIAQALQRTGALAQATAEARLAVDLFNRISAQDPANAGAKAQAAAAQSRLGAILLEAGDMEAGVGATRMAIRLLESLPEGLLKAAVVRHDRGEAHHQLGQALTRRALASRGTSRAAADHQQACESYAKALPIVQELLDEFKDLGPHNVHPDTVRQALKACDATTHRAPESRAP